MKITNVKRQELKFYIHILESERMRSFMSKLLTPDKNNKNNNSYLISSLYFESQNDKNLDEKLDGILSRQKIRIRIYNNNLKIIKLEKKIKNNTTIEKKNCNITKQDAMNLISQNYDKVIVTNKFMSDLVNDLKIFRYKPKVIVEYNREAYYLSYNNIRVTFDKNLSTYNNFVDLINLKKSGSVPIFDEKIESLEVKYENNLPLFLKEVISKIPASRSSISKYVLTQKYINYSPWRDNLINEF